MAASTKAAEEALRSQLATATGALRARDAAVLDREREVAALKVRDTVMRDELAEVQVRSAGNDEYWKRIQAHEALILSQKKQILTIKNKTMNECMRPCGGHKTTE